MKPFWTVVGLVAALLVQSALSHLAPAQARILDPFLLVVIYCALTWGETYGMLAGATAGWIQDVHFGGTILGLSGLTKVVLGFSVGAASTRFHLGEPRARILVLFAATVADAIIFEQLAQAFEVPTYRLSILGLLSRAVVNAALGAVLYELLGRRWRARRRI